MTSATPPKQPPSSGLCVTDSRAEVAKAGEQMLKAADARGYNRTAKFALRLAFEEAVGNAFQHGLARAPGKKIEFEWSVEPNRVSMRITDPGPGFDPDEVPDPTLQENLERTDGRGLLLMRAYMTAVEYNEHGNSVSMVYDRPSNA